MQSDTVYSFFLQHSSLLGTKDEQSELICPCQQSGSKALILWDKEYQCDVEQHLRAIRNEKAMGTKFLNHFRRRMANMRHHQLLPSADSKTGPPDLEKKYLAPLLDIFWMYVPKGKDHIKTAPLLGSELSKPGLWYKKVEKHSLGEASTVFEIWMSYPGAKPAEPTPTKADGSKTKDPVFESSCAALIVFSPSSFCFDDLQFEDPGQDQPIKCEKNQPLLQLLHEQNLETFKFLVVTDERRATILTLPKYERVLSQHVFEGNTLRLSEQVSLRCILGAVLSTASDGARLGSKYAFTRHLDVIAMNEPLVNETDEHEHDHGQKHEQEFEPVFSRNMRLLISDGQWSPTIPQVHAKKFHFRLDPEPLPQDTRNILAAQTTRERDKVVSEMLLNAPAEGTPLFFDVDHESNYTESAARKKLPRLSRVLFGKLGILAQGVHKVHSKLLCLKLVDRCLLSFATKEQRKAFEQRLSARKMIFNEHTVYNRLSEYQGVILPIMYGWVKVTLPGQQVDGAGPKEVSGLLMEAVDGVPLNSNEILQSPVSIRDTILRRIRHADRLMRYSGVKQIDWHGSQVLVKIHETDTHADEEITSPGTRVDVTFLDFANVLLRPGIRYNGRIHSHQFLGQNSTYDCDDAKLFVKQVMFKEAGWAGSEGPTAELWPDLDDLEC